MKKDSKRAQVKKLLLSRETLRWLDLGQRDDLNAIVGGSVDTNCLSPRCYPTAGTCSTAGTC